MYAKTVIRMLTQDKITELKEVLDQVNVADICRRVQVRRELVYDVLRGRSLKYKELAKVVRAARREILKREKEVADI
jgi:predicted transcriptional regulator